MRKPSIFSRDYERKMKKRKRIIFGSILATLIIGVSVVTFTIKEIDLSSIGFTNGNTNKEDEGEVQEVDNNVEESQGEKETLAEGDILKENPKEKVLEIRLSDDKILKVEYEEENDGIQLKEAMEIPNGIYHSISPSKKYILTIDEGQNIRLSDTKGETHSLTKEVYVAPDGENFNKDTVLSTYQGYLWSVEAKFISDSKIAYISNVPYFGTDLSKYIWIIDIPTKTHTTLWNSKGLDVKLGEVKDGRLEVNIDGGIKYIDNNGNLTN